MRRIGEIRRANFLERRSGPRRGGSQGSDGLPIGSPDFWLLPLAMPDEKPRTLNTMTALQMRGPARSSGYWLVGEDDKIIRVGEFRRVGPVGASSTLAACVGFGVLFALLVILRAMVWRLRQTENGKGIKPMTNNNRKMFADCTLETIWGVGISVASATLLA